MIGYVISFIIGIISGAVVMSLAHAAEAESRRRGE